MVPQMMNEKSRLLVIMINLKEISYEQTRYDVSLNWDNIYNSGEC